jgi:hypothetical protein
MKVHISHEQRAEAKLKVQEALEARVFLELPALSDAEIFADICDDMLDAYLDDPLATVRLNLIFSHLGIFSFSASRFLIARAGMHYEEELKVA